MFFIYADLFFSRNFGIFLSATWRWRIWLCVLKSMGYWKVVTIMKNLSDIFIHTYVHTNTNIYIYSIKITQLHNLLLSQMRVRVLNLNKKINYKNKERLCKNQTKSRETRWHMEIVDCLMEIYFTWVIVLGGKHVKSTSCSA